MSKAIDISGMRFGHLTVIREVGREHKEIVWECKCDCGNIVHRKSYEIRHKLTNCGCMTKDILREKNSRHGLYGTRIHRTYTNMKTRCYNPHYYLFKNYGGKGITICDEWLGENGLKNFADWSMKNGYSDKLSIDRIDNSKGYSPENCRWVDMRTQQNNRTNNRILSCGGESHTMAEWSKISGIPYFAIQGRLSRGWSEQDAVSRPLQRQKNREGKNASVTC